MPLATRPHFNWQLRTRSLALGARTRVMGIVNVTPDSFSDGGEHATTEQAVSHAMHLLEDGADILDIGGESTRPGSSAATGQALSTTEEQDRVLPVVEAVLRLRPDALISVDTYRAATARTAVQAGAEIVNDVSGGLWDRDMFRTCAELGCGAVVMHTRGLPSQWAAQTPYPPDDLLPQVLEHLRERVTGAVGAGVARGCVVVDPGFGFGKRGGENWTLLAAFAELASLGFPLMAGLSRKGFLLSALHRTTADDAPVRNAGLARDALTHAANTAAVLAGAHLLRVHDVRGAVPAAAVADAIRAQDSVFTP